MNAENAPIRSYQFLVNSVSKNGTENPMLPIPLENPPIEKRCGFETIDTIADGLLVHAPVDQVAEVLAHSGVRWERNVYGQTIRGRGLVVFQFRGHAWTGILDGYMTDKFGDILDGRVPASWNWESQAESLSQRLHTRTIYYLVDDVGCTMSYAYWENGTLMERLEFDESIWLDNHDEALLHSPALTFEPHLFESQLRQLKAPEIRDAHDFVWNFLCEQEAYAATRLSAFSNDFVRLDYIAFA